MKKVLVYLAVALCSAALVFVVMKYLPDGKTKSDDLKFARVNIGTVMSTFPAEGTVEPESEVLILSPASSIIKQVVKDVGSKVNAGEAMIILDPTPIQEQIEKMEDQLEVKKNSLRKNRLNAKSIRVDLDYNIEVRKLKIASIKSELADQEQLLDVGGISPARFEKTKQELVLAEKDLETLKSRNSIRLQQLETEDEGLQLQITIQEKELENYSTLLNRMIVRAPSAGIILSLDCVPGEKVNKDKLLVKMSNLSEFKIFGNAEDEHSDFVETGHQVIVKIGEEEIEGRIGTVSPVIKNKKVEFDVYLEQSNHQGLRPNLTLPMKIVVNRADSVLRVRKAPGISRGLQSEVFCVDGAVARKRTISTGIKGDRFVEILSGLEAGEQIVVSDLSSYRNKEQITIN